MNSDQPKPNTVDDLLEVFLARTDMIECAFNAMWRRHPDRAHIRDEVSSAMRTAAAEDQESTASEAVVRNRRMLREQSYVRLFANDPGAASGDPSGDDYSVKGAVMGLQASMQTVEASLNWLWGVNQPLARNAMKAFVRMDVGAANENALTISAPDAVLDQMRQARHQTFAVIFTPRVAPKMCGTQIGFDASWPWDTRQS